MSVMGLSMLVITPSRFSMDASGMSFRLDRARFRSAIGILRTAAAVAGIWRPFPSGRRPRVRTHSVMDGGVPTVGWAPTFIPRGREASSNLAALISTLLV